LFSPACVPKISLSPARIAAVAPPLCIAFQPQQPGQRRDFARVYTRVYKSPYNEVQGNIQKKPQAYPVSKLPEIPRIFCAALNKKAIGREQALCIIL